MSTFLVRNVRIVEPGRRIHPGDVLFRDGRIIATGKVAAADAKGATVVEGEGRLLTPGLIDLHTHGVTQCLYDSASGLRSAAKELPQFGVTTVLPTIIPQMRDGTLEKVAEIAAAAPTIREVNVPGLHLEGPFMALGGASCPTLPGSLTIVNQLIEAAGDRLAVMSLSPDAPDIVPVIRRLREKGIRVFMTHTRASVAQTEAAIDAGASHATHFYDVFPLPPETDPGVRPVGAVEVILGDPRATVDFIADGVHVHPAAIRAAIAAKGWAGVVLITDSNIGAGLPPGVYATPWGYQVRVSPERAARHVTKDTLAGSALTMNRGIANLLQWLKLPPEQVWAMGTLNPANVIGLDRKGRLETGADADLVLWEDDLTPARTWCGGQLVYEKKKQPL